MAPGVRPRENSLNFSKLWKRYGNISFIKTLLFDPSWLWLVAIGILAAEFLLNIFVIWRVKYTEIDWVAYMQECEGFLNGTLDYSRLKGDTGPLVYPGGFVYIYSILYFITSRGTNIKLAQYIFAFIYLLQMALVLRLYTKSRKVPPYVLVITAFTSYRIHSIYVLRLFNDPIAVLFLYIALNLFMDGEWSFGSLFYSLAVGVKMNILLYAPALLLFYLTNLGLKGTIKQLLICGAFQLALGAPFLLTYPVEYLKGSFDLGRVFEHKWTVNYRFLSREIFENKAFHLGLLGLHLLLLGFFLRPAFRYFQNYARLRQLQRQLQPQIDFENKQNKVKPKTIEEQLTEDQEQFLKSFEKNLQKMHGKEPEKVTKSPESEKKNYSVHFDKATQLALLPLFFCNFIGIVCARSLHYQFYVWYFHSLPYLVWSTPFATNLRFLLLLLIEYCWNTYPSTNVSSALLHGLHLILLSGVGYSMFKTLRLGTTAAKDKSQ